MQNSVNETKVDCECLREVILIIHEISDGNVFGAINTLLSRQLSQTTIIYRGINFIRPETTC